MHFDIQISEVHIREVSIEVIYSTCPPSRFPPVKTAVSNTEGALRSATLPLKERRSVQSEDMGLHTVQLLPIVVPGGCGLCVMGVV